jgi:hypothetical protein
MFSNSYARTSHCGLARHRTRQPPPHAVWPNIAPASHLLAWSGQTSHPPASSSRGLARRHTRQRLPYAVWPNIAPARIWPGVTSAGHFLTRSGQTSHPPTTTTSRSLAQSCMTSHPPSTSSRGLARRRTHHPPPRTVWRDVRVASASHRVAQFPRHRTRIPPHRTALGDVALTSHHICVDPLVRDQHHFRHPCKPAQHGQSCWHM